MIEGLIALLVVILVVGIVAWVILYCISLLPIEPPFNQMARVIVMLIAVLIILFKTLPLLGVSI